ncbi:MAG: HAMP domain-containing sensor histidine kinase [Azospirillaceae bacterium]
MSLPPMPLPRFTRSLSARLLVLTILFVMLAEVLIFTPSIARFRVTWLEDRLAAGHLATLSILATPDGMVTESLERELLSHVGAYSVDLSLPERDVYMLGRSSPPIDKEVDLDARGPLGLIVDAYETLFMTRNRVLHVTGTSPRDADARVEVVIDEAPLCAAMLDYGGRILGLSIVISLITAGLVFVALRWLMVRPMSRLTEKMVAFREDPENAEAIVTPTGRGDELGVAQRELHDMQTAVLTALKQKTRLAALGTAVTKINHDLRNILSTASLLSERLAMSEDPAVQRTTPRLIEALDRAVDLCQQTLTYTKEQGVPLTRSKLGLHELVAAAEADLAGLRGEGARWINEVPEHLVVQADRDQLLRALVNLGRNAFEAGAETVRVTAERTPTGTVSLTIADDGPGLPPRAREHLFQPFAASARPGGTGLGLAIAREILAAHRGDLRLVDSTAHGTTFRLELPL